MKFSHAWQSQKSQWFSRFLILALILALRSPQVSGAVAQQELHSAEQAPGVGTERWEGKPGKGGEKCLLHHATCCHCQNSPQQFLGFTAPKRMANVNMTLESEWVLCSDAVWAVGPHHTKVFSQQVKSWGTKMNQNLRLKQYFFLFPPLSSHTTQR